jgi:predicted nucleic acid-binding protein
LILVDTNVLLDIATRDQEWALWSLSKLEAASRAGPILINDIVYAELAVRYEYVEQLDDFVAKAGLQLQPIPKSALFLAAKAFGSYRSVAEHAPAFSLISSSARMRRQKGCRCSPAMRAAIGPIFRMFHL